MKLSVLIPIFNEVRTVEEIVKKSILSLNQLNKKGIIHFFEIILVDDGSDDGSKNIIYIKFSKLKFIKIISLKENNGKGYAISQGLKYATGNYILIQDADLEYNPFDYRILLEPVISNKADVVYGSRVTRKNKIFFINRIANYFLTILSNYLTGLKLTDMETGYKLIRTSIFKNLIVNSKDFGIEPEITAKLAKMKNLKFFEVPISYTPRKYSQGKKIGIRDGYLAIKYIIFYNLFSNKNDSFYRLNTKYLLKNETN